jgi:iron complex outermembrane recepter protein
MRRRKCYSMPKTILFAGASLLALTLSPSAAFAADDTALAADAVSAPDDAAAVNADTTDADNGTIIVVGQQDTPIAIEPRGLAISLGDEQFEGVNAINVEDLMKYAPNFFVRTRFYGDSNGVPGFRGTHSTQSARALVMVDGFVVSNFLGNSFGFAPKWGVVGPNEVEQFDIVYGPYSARYPGNSMGGIVNIATRDPEGTEAFVNVQSIIQPYRQYRTRDTYLGGQIEAGVGWQQENGPWSARLSGRYFRNDGHPQTFYGLTLATGAPGVLVTGAVTDDEAVRAIAEGRGIAGSPGTLTNPIFAAQSPARVTQEQVKAKIGYDDGSIIGQFLFAYWHNRDEQVAPDCYLRNAASNIVCEGRVTIGALTYTASGANFSLTLRDEFLAGLRVAAPIAEDWTARLALSTYRIAWSEGFTSSGYVAGQTDGAGTLADQGPTGWYTGDLLIEQKSASNEFAIGATANHYETDLTRFNLPNWRRDANGVFTTQTFGRTRTLSAFVENRFLFGDNAALTLGLRYDNWRAFDGGLGRVGTGAQAGQPVFNRYAARSDDAVSPAVALEGRLADGTRLQLSLAMATRFPTVGELFQGSLNGDGTFNVNSFDPNLRPETSRDLNFLASRQFGPLRLTGSFFYQRVANTIFNFTGFNQNGVTTSSFKNIDRTRQHGFELIGELRDWPVDGLSLDANAAYIDSRTLTNLANRASEGVQFPRIPRWRVNANLRYDITDAVQASLGMRFASRPNTDLLGLQRGDTFGFTSELFALDARLNWQLTDQFRVSAGVNNITNDRAWVFHPFPQRAFVLEAGWRL